MTDPKSGSDAEGHEPEQGQPSANEPEAGPVEPSNPNGEPASDPFGTLNEEPASPSDTPQVEKDAESHVQKWSEYDDDKKSELIQNLSENRKDTFQLIARKLGVDPDKLKSEFSPQRKKESSGLKEEILKTVEEQFQPAIDQANQQKFKSEIQSFAEHNDLTKEQAQELAKIGGDVYKEFENAKYDPATGQPLSFKGKIKAALSSNSVVQALINQKGAKKAEDIAAGVQAKVPGSSGASSKSVSEMTPQERLEAQNKEFKLD